MERDVLLLDDLLQRQRLEQMLDVADRMQSARDRLEKLMAEYKRNQTDAVKQEIERELKRMAERLAELQSKAQRLAHDVPDDFVNREALEGSDVQKRLDAIRDMLARGETDKAMEEMKRLSSMIDKMVASMEGDLKGFRRERFSDEEKALSELENQLADLEHDERQLKSETDDVQRRYRDEVRKQLRDRVQPLLEKARRRAEEMRKKLAGVDRESVPPFDQEDLDRARQRVDELAGALDQEDLEQARQSAHEAADELGSLSRKLRTHEERQWLGVRQGIKNARERVDGSEPIARELADELDKAFPKPEELLPNGDRKKLEGLSQQQEAVRRRTEEARKNLERKLKERAGAERPGQSQPGQPGGQPGGPAAGLEEAGRHMQRATDALRAGDPRDSSGEEGQAAEQLQQLRQQVQRERRPRNEGGAGYQDQHEVVKIPGADEYRAPREFREDLLDAMKREAPREFKDQVKRYYEELVR
jgi:hypothetical protein